MRGRYEEENNVEITNGKNILSAEEMGMDEPGGVIHVTLAHIMSLYRLDLDILLRDENELMRLADWRANGDEYKDCCIHGARCVYRAHNGRTKPFQIKYYLNSKNTRMYMVTRDPAHTYVTGVVYDMEDNAIDNIDLA